MRNALAGIVCLLAAGSLLAQCNQPGLAVSGIQGEMTAPCAGDLAFTNAGVTVTSSAGTGSGGGAGKSTTGPLKVNRFYDSASPHLFQACVNSTAIQKVTLYNPPMTITFNNVRVTSDSWSFNNGQASESVEFQYASSMIDTGGGSKIITNFIGTSRASSMSAAAVNGDGHSTPVESFTVTARPGTTTFTSVRLGGSPTLTTALRSGAPAGTPQESMSWSFGAIQIKYHGQTHGINFTGGRLVNGNLTVSKATYTGPTTVAVRP